jgi:hypothetical protein
MNDSVPGRKPTALPILLRRAYQQGCVKRYWSVFGYAGIWRPAAARISQEA